MKEGINNIVDGEQNEYNLHLTTMSVVKYKEWVYSYCLKVTPLQGDDMEDDELESTKSPVYHMYFPSDAQAPEFAYLYFTTESNAYGVVEGLWYDGIVDPYVIRGGMFHSIAIPETRAFEFVKSQCTDQPFYQCVSQRLKEDTTCSEYGPPCSYYTLPTNQPLEHFPYY